MIVKEFSTPRPHIIISELFSEKILKGFLEEAVEFKDKYEVGKMYNDKRKIKNYIDKRKKAKDLFLDNYYLDRSKSIILTTFDSIVLNKKMIKIYNNSRYPIFNTLQYTTIDTTHLIKYSDGDFYDWHKDLIDMPYGFITMSFMFGSKKKMFTGGDFELKWKDEVKTIPFKRNTLIIFPTNALHRVTPIKVKSADPYELRYTIQRWNV